MKHLPLAVPLAVAPFMHAAPGSVASAARPPLEAPLRAEPRGVPMYLLSEALEAERSGAYLASTQNGRVLYVEHLDDLSRPTRDLIADLEAGGSLTVRSGSVPVPITLPVELRVPPAVVATTGTSYPEANVGGVRYFIDVGTYQSYCTTGFAVRANDGRTAMTSAGHCGWKSGQPILASTGDDWTSGWTKQVSTVATTTWATDGAISGDALSHYSTSAKGHIYQGGTASRSVSSWANPTLSDTSICFRGATTGGTGSCGPIASIGMIYDVQGRQYPAFCISGAVPRQGDSGAPMYVKQGTDKASARGVLSFALDADLDQEYDHACGTPIGNVLAATKSTLLTN